MVKALAEARDTAYKGVVKPVEGTILTVAKDLAAAAEAALARDTGPDRDPGKMRTGRGRVGAAIPRNCCRCSNRPASSTQAAKVYSLSWRECCAISKASRSIHPLTTVQPLSSLNFDNAMQGVEEGQDYEVVVDFFPNDQFELQKFYNKLEEMGTSIQVGEGEGMYRMHIHLPLEKRYEPIDYIMSIGTITKVAMENLVAQMDEINAKSKGSKLELAKVEPNQIAVVVVSPGPGLSRIFASLGVAAIVDGGQTMNPSTQEILAAFENLPTDNVVILPNNKNILMASNQAKEVTVKNVAVVPSKSIPQGLAAMLVHNPDGELQAVAEKMTKALATVKTGEITDRDAFGGDRRREG